MGLGTGSGLGHPAASTTDVLADLVGQDIVAKSYRSTAADAAIAFIASNRGSFGWANNTTNFNIDGSSNVQLTSTNTAAGLVLSSTAAGSNALTISTAGARLKLSSGGTTDYFTSNGTTLISAAGSFGVTGDLALAPGSNITFGSATIFTVFNYGGALAPLILGSADNAAGKAAFNIGNDVALAETEDLIRAANGIPDSAATVFAVKPSGKLVNGTSGNSTGAPGNATLNTPTGRSAIAAAAGTCVITNSLVSATSIVLVVLQTIDTTATGIKGVVPASGSFTLTVNAAATATTNFGWIVLN